MDSLMEKSERIRIKLDYFTHEPTKVMRDLIDLPISLGIMLLPNYEQIFDWIVTVLSLPGELSLTFWLLNKGVKDQPRDDVSDNI